MIYLRTRKLLNVAYNKLAWMAKSPIVAEPTAFTFCLTTSCNLRCPICTRVIYKLPIKFMDQEIVKEIVNISSFTIFAYLVGPGEPLLYPNFLEVLKRMREKGVGIRFLTNATLLDKKIARELCYLGINEVEFSVDAVTQETYEKVRRGSGRRVDKMIENIKTLTAVKRKIGSNVPVLYINFVGMRDNIKELPNVVKMATELGVKQVRVANLSINRLESLCEQHLHEVPKLAHHFIEKARALSYELGVSLLVRPQIPTPKLCSEPWTTPYIDEEGNVWACNFCGATIRAPTTLWYSHIPIKVSVRQIENLLFGNIKYEKLYRIWNNHKARLLRKHLLNAAKEDAKINWSISNYKALLLNYYDSHDNIPLCRICPYRFGISC